MVAAVTTPAHALSCLRPDVTTGFVTADARPESFVMALGRLTRIGPDVPAPTETQTGEPGLPAPYSFSASFAGQGASLDGFNVALETEVEVRVNCGSAWCGNVPLDDPALIYLRMTDDGSYVFEADLCDPFSYSAPTEAEQAQVLECLQGGTCG